MTPRPRLYSSWRVPLFSFLVTPPAAAALAPPGCAEGCSGRPRLLVNTIAVVW